MRVVFRADASIEHGTGHVMRCLTLAEELDRRGHEVHLLAAPIHIAWLRQAIADAGVALHPSEPRSIDLAQVAGLRPDWLVVDSYEIPAAEISSMERITRVLAIIDGDDRDIEATLYLDQNLGAESQLPRHDRRRLYGSRFALVRQAIVSSRKHAPWKASTPNRVLCFMGGTDPFGNVVGAARSIAELGRDIRLTVVAPASLHARVLAAVSEPTRLELLALSPTLPDLISRADIVVSAAGTSAWEVCTLGIPSVFVAVVENQLSSLRAATGRGLALGIDAVNNRSHAIAQVGQNVERLVDDEELRRHLSDKSLEAFDGMGARRVATRLESRLG